MLAIIASELDSHADAVIMALRDMAFDAVVRIDLETAQRRFDFALDPASGDFILASRSDDGPRCDNDAVRTIWWRRANSQVQTRQSGVPTATSLDAAETYWAARWLIESLPTALFPLSHPLRMRAAQNKLWQLRMANEVGLTLPRTLFTNDKARLAAFAARCGALVIKPLQASMVHDVESDRYITLTSNAVAAGDLASLLAAEPEIAIYAQEKISKIADIRVNVLPSRSIACRIDTSGLAAGQVDWRMTTFDHPHAIIDLPPGLDEKCRALLDRLGLCWGAFDFGLTESGEWIFFECNPNGQWFWIELATGAPLSRLFAEHLLAHHSRA